MWLRWHRVIGLSAALWVLLVGATGFLLDHKDWRWMRQSTLPDALAPADLRQTSRNLLVRLYQVDPVHPERRIAAGWRGVWWTGDGGGTWAPAAFRNVAGVPLVHALDARFTGQGSQVWLGTDDGIWRSLDGGRSYEPFALQGRRVTMLAVSGGTLTGVLDRTQVFELDTASGAKPRWLELGTVAVDQVPGDYALDRVLVNHHIGWGILPGTGTLQLNDLTAVCMVLLPATGLLIWWRRRQRRSTRHPDTNGADWRLWGRGHFYVLGLPAMLPMLLLAVSGVLLAVPDLRAKVSGYRVAASLLPAPYRLTRWDGEISAAIREPGRWLIGTRHGLLSSTDEGANWRSVPLGDGRFGAVWGFRKIDDALYVLGSTPARCHGGECRKVSGLGGMTSDVARLAPETMVAFSHHGATALGGEVHAGHGSPGPQSLPLPELSGVPWQFVINQIHSGALYAGTAKPIVNVMGALALLLLAVTGVARWVTGVRRRP